MFNQETGSSTNYLIIACMVISFARRFLFFQSNVQMNSKEKKKIRWNFSLIFCLQLYVCVFIPKCGLFAGLNFEAILVVLIDVLLAYLICKVSSDGSLWKHGNYLKRSTRYRTCLIHMKALTYGLFCLPLWETNWKWIILSHCNLTSRSCWKDALGCSPICAWRALKARKHTDSLLYPRVGVTIQGVLLLVHQITQTNWNVY